MKESAGIISDLSCKVLGKQISYQVCSERRVMGPESNSEGACEESGNRSRLLVGVLRLRDGSSAAVPPDTFRFSLDGLA
jgi:hypothetical protein